MLNDFDYILEEAEYDNDPDSVYSEMDLALAEFDAYVQEGVGVAVLAGIGIAAALGGLIALIIKLFGRSSASSTASEAKRVKEEILRLGFDGGETLPPALINAAVDVVEYDVEYVENICNQIIDLCKSGQDVDEARLNELIMEEYEKRQKRSEKYQLTTTGSNQLVHISSKEEAIDSVEAIEKSSEKIADLNKQLQKTQREMKKAEESGNVKLSDVVKQKVDKAFQSATNTIKNSKTLFDKALRALSPRKKRNQK